MKTIEEPQLDSSDEEIAPNDTQSVELEHCLDPDSFA